ncbi:uncharacterized protein METZ01_LOCUS516191, partial [marine metagenome]
KKAFVIALKIFSDLNGAIEPSRRTTLRLNKLTLFTISASLDTDELLDI